MACGMKFAHCRLWEAFVKTHKYCIYWPLPSQCSIYCTSGSLRAPPTANSGRISYYRPFSIKFCLLRLRQSRRSIGEHLLIYCTVYSIQHISPVCTVYCVYGSSRAPPKALSRQNLILKACSMKFAHCRLWEALV
jgi:hypothetical protein